jgi:hypothetical protein
MFEACIIGSDHQAELDIVHLNMTLPWFLHNVVRAIAAEW